MTKMSRGRVVSEVNMIKSISLRRVRFTWLFTWEAYRRGRFPPRCLPCELVDTWRTPPGHFGSFFHADGTPKSDL